MKRFGGKVVIITGSSSGIGQTSALAFADEGASVLIHGQNKERLDKTEKSLLGEGVPPNRICKVVGSMEDPKTAEMIIAECLRKFARIDVLINNAGALGKPNEADVESLPNLDYLYNVNLKRSPIWHTYIEDNNFLFSAIHLTQLALPHLERAKGNVVSVSTCLAIRQGLGVNYYSMLKAALDHWSRGMAMKWAPKGVRFNCVNPGPIATPIFERNGFKGEAKSLHALWVEKTTPAGRYGETHEIASALKFLASEEASYVTGVSLSVDGGWAIASLQMDQL